jgi:GntR family transcriptional regulator / MocR family aminotransferase
MTTLELPLVVERDGAAPMAAQIAGQLRDAVISGVLGTGERLPSTRGLAETLGVSRTVVTAAYTQLFAEGWLEGRHGSGTYVAHGVTGVHASAELRGDGELSGTPEPRDAIEFRPGTPWARGIEPAMWRRAWRHAGVVPPSAWPDSHGVPALRAELARYLRRGRGLSAAPEQILITRGVAAGLAQLAAALVRPGDRVGIEEPGYPSARQTLARAGAVVVPCRTDAHGIIPAELPPGLRMVYTTPAHQYPLGGRLPIARRQELTAWARTAGAIIVEDDYDSEFRYDVAPLPALYSMDPEVVVYLGTTSKTLTPALGVGWLVAAPHLVATLARQRLDLNDRWTEPAQLALLDMLASGGLERHIRRMRLEYARRRAVLVDTVAGLAHAGGPPATALAHAGGPPAGFRLLGDTAGLHVVLALPPGLPAERVVAAAHERGLALWSLDRYFAGPVTIQGIVIGYGTASLSQTRLGAAILRDVLSVTSGTPASSGYAATSG